MTTKPIARLQVISEDGVTRVFFSRLNDSIRLRFHGRLTPSSANRLDRALGYGWNTFSKDLEIREVFTYPTKVSVTYASKTHYTAYLEEIIKAYPAPTPVSLDAVASQVLAIA